MDFHGVSLQDAFPGLNEDPTAHAFMGDEIARQNHTRGPPSPEDPPEYMAPVHNHPASPSPNTNTNANAITNTGSVPLPSPPQMEAPAPPRIPPLAPYQPNVGAWQNPAVKPPAVAVPQLVDRKVQPFTQEEEPEPGYLAALSARSRDVQKLFVLGLMVTLGISIHWLVSTYLERWLQVSGLVPRQELLARLAYPALVLFAIWNVKALGPWGR